MNHTTRVRASRRVTAGAFALVGLSTALGVTGASGVSSHAKSVVVSTLKTAKYGTILVSGKTLYTLKPSGAGCTGACLKYWPELLLPKGDTKATAGPGVDAAKLGTVKRAGGALQVTYAGKALYWFALDSGPGRVTGVLKDAWGQWNVVVTVKPHGSGGGTTTTTTAPGGGGVGF